MMKRIVIVILFVTTSMSSFSQSNFFHKIGDTIYYQNNRATYFKTDVFAIIKGKIDDTNHFEVEKYVTDPTTKKPYLESRFLSNDVQTLRGDGSYKLFYRNGKVAIEGNLLNGKRGPGTWVYWHENGQKRMEEGLSKETFFTENRVPLINNFWDEKGNQIASEGKGKCEYKDATDKLIHKGSIKKGLRVGSWSASKDNKVVYEETYKKGKVVKGVSFNEEGKRFQYKKIFEEAYYIKHGVKTVRKYLNDNIKPNISRISGILITTFDISKEGKISNVEVKRGLTSDYNKEVKRIISEMDSWKPARQRGINVASKYTLSLSIIE